MDNNNEKREALATNILTLSRNTLLVNLRFLDMALSQFDYVKVEGSTIMTDGKHIYYDPSYILKSYMSDRQKPVRDYLHVVLHCVLRHLYVNPSIYRPYWDLACDMAVENMISELNLKAVYVPKEMEQQKYLNDLKSGIKLFTAEKIYHYFLENRIDEAELLRLSDLFKEDDHISWYEPENDPEQKSSEDSGNEDRDSSQSVNSSQSGSAGESGDEEGDGSSDRREMEETWKKISERMQVDIAMFGKGQGTVPGSMTMNLKAVNREKYDYTAFLKKFAVMGETMKINDDEFDYIFYTYGLEHYRNMPLIEPLEYKEIKKIREFVIAIDTSGSTSGDLVQKFIQKTYNILKSTDSFFSKVNIHIIQCDTEIQEDVKISSEKDLEQYLKTMKIRGLGGTDFRPVFAYVDQLRRAHEFTNLKGLIYFTDGNGTFPRRKPDYDTAFVYVEDEYNNPEVPSWAIRLVLQSDEI